MNYRAESTRIAALIFQNCEAYFAGHISREAWDAEQLRLWQRAERRHCRRAVVRLVDPLRKVG